MSERSPSTPVQSWTGKPYLPALCLLRVLRPSRLYYHKQIIKLIINITVYVKHTFLTWTLKRILICAHINIRQDSQLDDESRPLYAVEEEVAAEHEVRVVEESETHI